MSFSTNKSKAMILKKPITNTFHVKLLCRQPKAADQYVEIK